MKTEAGISNNRRENSNVRIKGYKRWIRIVRLLVIIQFATFLSIFISSIHSIILGAEPKMTLTVFSGLMSMIHIIFGYKLFKTYRGIIEEDKLITRLTIIEGFIFANVPGLILTIIAKARQEEEIEYENDIE